MCHDARSHEGQIRFSVLGFLPSSSREVIYKTTNFNSLFWFHIHWKEERTSVSKIELVYRPNE
jgi:hypothetical protein